ncbi:MAG: DUF3866 family protein [Bacillota bacterium]|nr:DUF3866 family protein [Bacillota bacterium]
MVIYIRLRRGHVARLLGQRPGLTEILVNVDGKEEKAVCYEELTGPVAAGDEVILNTTAVHKDLGTGGYHFVVANLNITGTEVPEAGHIMKLRYAPGQLKVLAAEEDDSPLADAIRGLTTLDGMPVLVGSLHSQLGPSAAALRRQAPAARLAYVMTDGGALPIAFSRLVRELRETGVLDFTVTCGHAFGGDLEAVNIYSGLLAAMANGADAAIVAMGPGVVGTGSPFGCTALEQGQLVNAVHTLGGLAIAIPRIGFADPRSRHRGLSHHTRTALGRVALAPCYVALPDLPPDQASLIRRQAAEAGLAERHRLVTVPGDVALEAMRDLNLKVTTMGRGPDTEPAFFLAAGAAAVLAARALAGRLPPPQ